ncbi:MAG: isoleucine--tRNA ligase [Anaerolineaceae bacterium]|nr:isoleucine--tRNA ligase [Chloroflexota bacterium]NOG75233.1 isoleucine--tRNA ligase [Chloroflexota bacterium]GIK10555.1 MAG: isoleucine--tRNA ligase [Chloroflexota bacterium]GJQ37925.1 MAG: isoleucine--tRNA ligase [Anaerolineaceae bacterium]HMM99751.1 isoleucine--tRNA ligase [Anaerolineales bacterium]
MSFKSVSPKLDVTAMEEAVLKMWKREDVFKKTVERRQGAPEYVFYEGPPTANGKPGVHHVLARAFKDMFPRYKIMRGYRVSRRGGWDTHGLPVEIEVEKRHGFKNKQDIEAYGVAKFNAECRKSAFDYIQDWERLTDRIAFWVDLETAYVTFTNDYIESVWNILKNFWDRDLLYKGYKVVPYCPRCGTTLSDHEVALGYDEATDPSVFVRMPLADKPDTSLLVWTTTPWTLPGNVAVAAHPDVEYVTVERAVNGKKEKLILAKPLLEKVFRGEEVKIVDAFKGRKLKGQKYLPLFTFLPPDKPAHYVVLGDFVTTEDGTGLVHMAPAFGAEDMQAALEFDLPVLMTVLPDGSFIPEVTPWRGVFVKDADPMIIRDLDDRGLLFRAESYTHTYPFCWRCKTPLLYYARDAWYIRTSRFKDRMVELNKTIHWTPDHIRDGRFGNWLENNIDWALSRERYWGTPLPVWECEDCKDRECVGSVDELSKFAGRDLNELDLHRPYVDEVAWDCKKCGGRMQRVPDLIDVWFDSGSMPYAQWHYPFENQEKFKQQFPADFICEAVDQTRGWFYSLHAISSLLMDSVSFKNVICLGLILDGEGRKMSKSLGNIVDPWDVLKVYGADAFRWYLYTATPPGQERRFSPELVGSVVRDFTLLLWNVYSFFVTYANLDKWKPEAQANLRYSSLDQWLLSELNVLVREVTAGYEEYEVTRATRPIQEFVEKLSTWYLRRSRRRFWKSESDSDKQAAYSTLYAALVTVAKLLAPAMPFLADELYQNLVRSADEDAPESIHLARWPETDVSRIDETLNRDMATVMKLVSLGHSARQKANRKVRQPLSEAAFSVGNVSERKAVEAFAELIADELNVKRVRLLDSSTEAVAHTIKPLPKQLGQKYGNKFPAIQKAILAMDAESAARTLMDGVPLKVEAGGETFEVLGDEVEVKAVAKEGFAVAEEGAYVAALVTELTPELVRDGLAREFVRRAQDLRKSAELEVADRIRMFVVASEGLKAAVEEHRDYVTSETLTVDLQFMPPPADAFTASDSFDGETLTVGLVKA